MEHKERAEWDETHAVVIQIEQVFPEGGRHVFPTQIPRRPDSKTRWREVDFDFPDDYLPDFPELLGPAVYDPQPGGRLRKWFPHADFSVENVRGVLRDRLADLTRSALSVTDGYLVRKVDTGEEVPEDVAENRDKIRKAAKDYKRQIDKADPSELAYMEIRLPEPAFRRKGPVIGSSAVMPEPLTEEQQKNPPEPEGVEKQSGIESSASHEKSGAKNR